MHAIEIGPAMATKLRSKLRTDRLRVSVGDFEELQLLPASADAVFSATGFAGSTFGCSVLSALGCSTLAGSLLVSTSVGRSIYFGASVACGASAVLGVSAAAAVAVAAVMVAAVADVMIAHHAGKLKTVNGE